MNSKKAPPITRDQPIVRQFVPPLRVAEQSFDNPKHPIGYRVHDGNDEPLVAHSGIHGWGWCHSRAGAILHAGLSESDVE